MTALTFDGLVMAPRFFFYAQGFGPAGGGVEAQRFRNCADESAAVHTAERMAARHTGAIACRIEGDAQVGVWGDPVRLAEFGKVAPTKRA